MRKINNVIIYLPFLGNGGVETASLHLGRGFVSKGISVTYLVNSYAVRTNESLFREVGAVISLNARMYSGYIKLYLFLKTLPGESIVISHQTPCNFVASIAVRFLKDVAHFPVLHVSLMAQLKGVKRSASVLVYRIIAAISGVLVCVSRGLADECIHRIGISRGRIVVIYNSLYDRLDYLSLSFPAERKVALNLVASGRFTEQKNFDFLVDVFFRYQELHNQSRLTILGDGPLMGAIKEKVNRLGLSNKVKLPGFVNNVDPYYEGADVFLLTSIYEGFGIVLIDAIRNGVPFVAVSCDHGPREIKEGTGFGVVVDDFDVDKFVKGVEQVGQHLSGIDNEKVNSYLEQFTGENVSSRYLSL